jgi:hypothetical protein
MKGFHPPLALELLVRARPLIHGRYVLGRFTEYGPAPRGSAVHQHHVHGHAIEPGREASAVAKIPDAAVHLQEDLLDDVFEISLATQHTLREASDVLAVVPKKLPKRLGIALLAALDEARWIHGLDFNSDWPRWLALGDGPPSRNTGRGGHRGRKD